VTGVVTLRATSSPSPTTTSRARTALTTSVRCAERATSALAPVGRDVVADLLRQRLLRPSASSSKAAANSGSRAFAAGRSLAATSAMRRALAR
jgi:hypothetical protein